MKMKKNVLILSVVVGTLFSGPAAVGLDLGTPGQFLGRLGKAPAAAWHEVDKAHKAARREAEKAHEAITNEFQKAYDAGMNEYQKGENFGKEIGRAIKNEAGKFFPTEGIIEFPPPPPQTPYIARYKVSLKNDIGTEVLFKVGSSENYIVSPKTEKKLSSAEKNPVVIISKLSSPKKCPKKKANERCWRVVVEDKQTLPNAFIIHLDEYSEVVVDAIK